MMLTILLIAMFLPTAPYVYAASLSVNSLNDGGDAFLGNGVCSTEGGECTLRAAIQEANALAGPDTIAAQPERALQLAGFAAALRVAIGAPLPPAEQARVDRMIAPAHAALSETAPQAWAIGQNLTLDQAIGLAQAMPLNSGE